MEAPEPIYDPRQYAVIGVYHDNAIDPALLSDSKGRVVVWDNALVAQNWIPSHLGFGRLGRWTETGERIYWFEPHESGFRGACIIHPYTIYDLPPNFCVLSETRQMDWKHHIIWTDYERELGEARGIKTHRDRILELARGTVGR